MDFKGRRLGYSDRILFIANDLTGFQNLCRSVEIRTTDDRVLWINPNNYSRALMGVKHPRVLDWMVGLDLYPFHFRDELEIRRPVYVTYEELLIALKLDSESKNEEHG
jgi:hypothetical protein